jgi:hypothetical protein
VHQELLERDASIAPGSYQPESGIGYPMLLPSAGEITDCGTIPNCPAALHLYLRLFSKASVLED